MITNKPNVQRYDDMGCPEQICRVDTIQESDDGDFVLYEDYEALAAECEKLRTALAESRANDRQAMYYLNQVRGIVGGDDFPDMVERCRELQAERDTLLSLLERSSEWVYPPDEGCRCNTCREALALADAINVHLKGGEE